MPRAAALKESDWFELADEVAGAGHTPSTKLLASVAQERFGVSASFTTIQRALDSWRRLGGEHRPSELSPEFLQIVLKGFEPVYQQLLAQARAEFEPRLEELQAQAEHATARLESVRTENEQLHNERTHLRDELRAGSERERTQTATLAHAQTKSDELQASIEALTARHRQQIADIEARVDQQENRHSYEREQFMERQRVAVAEVTKNFETEIAALLTRSRTETERRDIELTRLREAVQSSQASHAALEAQKQVLANQLDASKVSNTDMANLIEQLRAELQTAQGRTQRAEQALRDSRAANVQMEAAYQERINALQQHLDELSKGQAVIQQQFVRLVEQMAQRSRSGSDST